MRVIFLTHNYPRFSGDLAGGFLHPLARALRDRGVEVRVIAPADRGEGGSGELDGVPVERVRYAGPEREILAYTGRMQDALRSPAGLIAFHGLWKALREAAAAAVRHDPAAVVHAHWWIPAGLAAPTTAPLVLTSHGTDVRLLAQWAPARWLAQPVYHRARVVTAVSKYLARIITHTTGREVPDDRVQPMPVDTSNWSQSTGGGGIIAVARLTSQKRMHLLIEAMARLGAAGQGVRCTIVGDGPERAALEQLAKTQGVADRIEFTGQLEFSAVLPRLARADVAVLPAVNEGFGLSAAEALMAGVPIVVCTDGGGLVDLAGAGAGRVVPPDSDSIARAIGEVMTDPGARDRARRSGQEWRERLAPSAVARRFEGWYAEALGA